MKKDILISIFQRNVVWTIRAFNNIDDIVSIYKYMNRKNI